MLDSRKKIATIKAHNTAKEMERPYVRFCADVLVRQPYSFEEIRRFAIFDDGDAAFTLGSYEEKLKLYVVHHFGHFGFPYSSLEVDGIKKNGRINIALWLIKSDVENIHPHAYSKVLADVSIIDVYRRVRNWEEVFEKSTDHERTNAHKQMMAECGRTDPMLLETVYNFGGIDRFDLSPSPAPFSLLPPYAWQFYGEEPAPQWVVDVMKNIRKSPYKFQNQLKAFIAGRLKVD